MIDPHREYGTVCVELTTPAALESYLRRRRDRWRIAYFNDRLKHEFDALCTAAYAVGGWCLVIEETDLFCSPSFISEAFEHIIQYGRHAGADHETPVSSITISRRPAELHRLITSQAWEIYAFATQEPRDLAYLRELVGLEFSEGLEALPMHTYRHMNLEDRTAPMRTEKLDLSAPAAAGGVSAPA